MACEIIQVDGDLVRVRISGVMLLSEQQGLQKLARDLMAQDGKVRLLAIVENFQGWEKGVDWSDVDFLLAHGNDIVKMAIVGDERWKVEALAFVGKGFRTTQIEFFSPSSLKEAEAWVRA